MRDAGVRDDLIADCLAANHSLTLPISSEALSQRLAYLEKTFRNSPRFSAQRAKLGYALKNLQAAAERARAKGVDPFEDSQCLLSTIVWMDAHADLLSEERSRAAFTFLPDNIAEDYAETRRDLCARFQIASEREQQQYREILDRAIARRVVQTKRRQETFLSSTTSEDFWQLDEAQRDKAADLWLGVQARRSPDALDRLRVSYSDELLPEHYLEAEAQWLYCAYR